MIFLSACQPSAFAAAPDQPPSTDVREAAPEAVPTLTADSTDVPVEPTATELAENPGEPKPTSTQTTASSGLTKNNPVGASPAPAPTTALITAHTLSPEAWKSWPVTPQVPETARDIYEKGLALGNDPHSFSILGDCQSLPETFLGVYDTNPDLVASLPADLQAAIANFSGSFDQNSPTIKGGTTSGAILWAQWHENAFTCQATETPLACELRLHKPSIVIINLGTHYETRNINYLRKILDQLVSQGIVPILSTKADNRELDDRLNMEMALLAVEYNIPMWNFYAAVSDLPNNGVGIKEGEEHLGEIYLSEEGLERHRYTALQALAAVWQAVRQP